ncbi:MAG: hypothetical protein ACREIC_26030 [Limisphaerales bacterium]
MNSSDNGNGTIVKGSGDGAELYRDRPKKRTIAAHLGLWTGFTHASLDRYRIVKANVFDDATTDRLIPFTIFTEPELARIGLTEAEARKEGLEIRMADWPSPPFLGQDHERNARPHQSRCGC